MIWQEIKHKRPSAKFFVHWSLDDKQPDSVCRRDNAKVNRVNITLDY